jgi:hypothetical protein
MTIQASNNIIAHFEKIEQEIINGNPCISYWNGVQFRWLPLSMKNGGTLKRKNNYGNIQYLVEVADRKYEVVSRDVALTEAQKPHDLRQALIEANTMLECSMCGLIVVGEDAIEPYTSITYSYKRHEVIRKKQWGLVFWKMKENNEPLTLNICPACLQRIANGEFRE